MPLSRRIPGSTSSGFWVPLFYSRREEAFFGLRGNLDRRRERGDFDCPADDARRLREENCKILSVFVPRIPQANCSLLPYSSGGQMMNHKDIKRLCCASSVFSQIDEVVFLLSYRSLMWETTVFIVFAFESKGQRQETTRRRKRDDDYEVGCLLFRSSLWFFSRNAMFYFLSFPLFCVHSRYSLSSSLWCSSITSSSSSSNESYSKRVSFIQGCNERIERF